MLARCPAISTFMLVTVLAQATAIRSAGAFEISFGLDRGTTDAFTKDLPINIRIELFKLIQDSLPLIDSSVHGYIGHIDEVFKTNISDGIDHLSCNTQGVIENYKDSIGSSLASIFFKPDDSGKLVPPQVPPVFSGLDKAINETRSNIRPRTSIREIELAYADLLHSAAVVACKATAVKDAPSNRLEVQQQIAKLSGPALEWKVLSTLKICNNPYECVQKRHDYVQDLLKTEDARDVRLSGANEAFSNILSWPSSPNFLQVWMGATFDILPYEDILVRLRAIERGIAGERAKRETSAAESWSAADKLEPQINTALESVTSVVNGSEIPFWAWANAISQCTKVVDVIIATNKSAKLASELDARYSEQYGKRKSLLQDKLDSASKLYEKAAGIANHYPATQPPWGKKYPLKLQVPQL